MIERLIGKIACALGAHDWTSAVLEGEKATAEQLDAGVDGFFDHAKLYCRRPGCEEVSPHSRRMISNVRTQTARKEDSSCRK